MGLKDGFYMKTLILVIMAFLLLAFLTNVGTCTGIIGIGPKQFDISSSVVDEILKLKPGTPYTMMIELRSVDGVTKPAFGILVPADLLGAAKIVNPAKVTGQWIAKSGSRFLSGLISGGSLIAWLILEPTNTDASDMIMDETAPSSWSCKGDYCICEDSTDISALSGWETLKSDAWCGDSAPRGVDLLSIGL
jgi:hypothetical protein